MIVSSKRPENLLRDEPLWPWCSQPGCQLEKMILGKGKEKGKGRYVRQT
jgi:hypothetical protein